MAGTDQHTATRFRRSEIHTLCLIPLLILMILTCAGLFSGKPAPSKEMHMDSANHIPKVDLLCVAAHHVGEQPKSHCQPFVSKRLTQGLVI